MTLQDIDLKYASGVLTTGAPFAINNSLTVTGTMTAATLRSPSIAADTQPGDVGLIAWTYDPVQTSATTTTAANTIYLSAVYIRYATTVNKLWFVVNSAAVTPTAGANNVGLYNASGTLLGSVNVDSAVTSTGPHSATVTGVPVTPGMYWVAMQFQASTQPGIGRANAAILSTLTLNQAAAVYRFATNGSGTTLPASITPGSNSTTGSGALWAGVS